MNDSGLTGGPAGADTEQPIRLTGLRLAADDQLPGWLAPMVHRIDGSSIAELLPRPALSAPQPGRRSAVLMLLADGAAGPDLLLTARASTLRAHAGQPAFPGGKQDPGEDAVQTAVREAMEETGLQPASVTPVALFPDLYLGFSGFLVSPVLAHWHTPGPVGPVDAAETAAVARVPVADLADPANRGRVRHPAGYIGPAFEVAGMVVWGFTAGLVEVLLDLGGWTRPWDRQRFITLPELGRQLADPEAGHLGDPEDDGAAPQRTGRPGV
jgi:8-oxo-dGTP pyrophosphatase MutT (NUDIX family)